MKPSSLAMILAANASLVACGGSSPTGAGATPPVPTPTPAATTARYRVTFETAWSLETHPTDFPSNPHFSPLIGATHSARVGFWQLEATASDGIEAMAELGRVSPLDTEMEAAVAQGTARQVLRGSGIGLVPGMASIEFDIDREQPLVTLVSMIAPSHDWFVGVHDLNLIEGGDWVAEKVVTLFPYDAGTDNGATYESPDLDAQPREAIRRIQERPLTNGGTVAPFGSFTFRRLR